MQPIPIQSVQPPKHSVKGPLQNTSTEQPEEQVNAGDQIKIQPYDSSLKEIKQPKLSQDEVNTLFDDARRVSYQVEQMHQKLIKRLSESIKRNIQYDKEVDKVKQQEKSDKKQVNLEKVQEIRVKQKQNQNEIYQRIASMQASNMSYDYDQLVQEKRKAELEAQLKFYKYKQARSIPPSKLKTNKNIYYGIVTKRSVSEIQKVPDPKNKFKLPQIQKSPAQSPKKGQDKPKDKQKNDKSNNKKEDKGKKKQQTKKLRSVSK